MMIKYQETQTAAHQHSRKHHNRHITTHVTDQNIAQCYNQSNTGSQTIQPVSQVNRISCANQQEYNEESISHCQLYIPAQKRDCHRCTDTDIIGRKSQYDRKYQLSQQFLFRSQTQRTFFYNFNIVIDKTDKAKTQCTNQHKPCHTGASRQKNSSQNHTEEKHYPTHSWCTLFLQMTLWSVRTDTLPKF